MDMYDLTQLPSVGEGTAQKLKEGGILTVMAIATSTPGQLGDAAGMTPASARKIINAARELCQVGFEMGIDVEKKQTETAIIPTYCEPVDKLLGGGLRLGTTLEAFGEFSSGKTNLSHLLTVSALKNFPEGHVYWIDTENTFSAKRIRQFCEGLEVDPEDALSRLHVTKALNSDHQILLTESVEKEIVEKKIDAKLLIVDSLMNHFRAEFLGRGTLAGRQQMINGYLHKIAMLVSRYGMAVYMTNQVQDNPGQMFGSPIKSVGGHVVGHFATIRVWLSRAAKGNRRMKLIDSPDLPEGEAVFSIEENGFFDEK